MHYMNTNFHQQYSMFSRLFLVLLSLTCLKPIVYLSRIPYLNNSEDLQHLIINVINYTKLDDLNSRLFIMTTKSIINILIFITIYTLALSLNFLISSHELSYTTHSCMRRDISVGIATRYGQDGPGIESRWAAKFSAPVQTGPGVHPASCTIGTGSF